MLFYNRIICIVIYYSAAYAANFANLHKIQYLHKISNLNKIDNLSLKYNAIIHFDDLINFYKDQEIVSIVTKILPLLNNYNKIELVISKKKMDTIIMNIPQILFETIVDPINKFESESEFKSEVEYESESSIFIYHEYAIEKISSLVNKTNIDISIVYSKNPEIAMDYYIAKIAMATAQKTYVIKNHPISILMPYWDLCVPSKILMIKKKYMALYSISEINLYNDIYIPYIKTIKDFLE